MALAWEVDEAAHQAFVALSGDRNSIHVDPIAARRVPFGRRAVHGMHLLLGALEALTVETDLAPRHVRCTFRHSVGVGDPITTTIEESGERHMAIRVGIDVWIAAEIDVELGDAPAQRPVHIEPPATTEPEVHDIHSLDGLTGSIPVTVDTAAALLRFPRLTRRIGIEPLAALVSVTRLVGMHVPGESSLLSSVDLTVHGAPGAAPGVLEYAVTSADERFSRVGLEVSSSVLSGTVSAFVRPLPVSQQLNADGPRRDEFRGQRWLVVGGSRGLGEATVLLLAAGGADVRFTYHQGAADADDLVARVPAASAYQFDVHDMSTGLDAVLSGGWQPTHVAYMATPPIFDGMRGVYSESLHDRLREVYVDRFLELLDRLRIDRLSGVLWPSTIAVEGDVPGLAEYADAKRAGEAACALLPVEHPSLHVATPRFPRLLTDQTTSFVPVEFGDTTAELLAALRGVAG